MQYHWFLFLFILTYRFHFIMTHSGNTAVFSSPGSSMLVIKSKCGHFIGNYHFWEDTSPQLLNTCNEILFTLLHYLTRCMYVCVLGHFGHLQLLVILWTVACQAPLSVGFSSQEYQSALPGHPPGNLPNPGIEPESLRSPALVGRFFTTNTTWGAHLTRYALLKIQLSCHKAESLMTYFLYK